MCLPEPVKYSEHGFAYQVETQQAGQTIGQYLKEKGYSRQIFIHLKKTEDGIRRNGRWAYTRDRLEAGDFLQTRLLEEVSLLHPEPVRLPFTVVYEDEHLLVAGKPEDMPVHPSMNNHGNTLANAVLARHDRMKAMAEDNYRSLEIEQERQQERGIILR